AIAYFLPETLHIAGDVETQMLHRGIYDAAVFRAQVTLSGKFSAPDFGPLKIDVKDLQWKDAFVTIAVNDLRGTREAMMLDWGGLTDSMGNGRCRITVAIIRNRGRVAPATNVSVFCPLRIRVSVFSFCRFWTHIATSNARLNMVCCFLCWFLQLSFSLRSRRDRKFIRFNI